MPARFHDRSEKDLFDQFQVGEKKIRKKTRVLLPQLKKNLSLSYENAIFLIIGFTMACIICFSLGVEKGRRETRHTKVASVEVKQRVNEQTKIKDKYIIQLAAFNKRGPAEDELKKLKREGYIGNIKRSGDYYQLFIGGFDKKRDADILRKKLLKKYPDCYVKKY